MHLAPAALRHTGTPHPTTPTRVARALDALTPLTPLTPPPPPAKRPRTAATDDDTTPRPLATTQRLRACLHRFKAVYRVVATLHEPVAPVGSAEHAITGHLTVGSLHGLVRVLQCDLPVAYRLTADSVYLDVGSGMGRPALCVATLPVRLCVGIECQRDVHAMSVRALRRLHEGARLSAPVYFEHGDVSTVASLGPTVTHVHLFTFSHPAQLAHVAALVAWSDRVKVLTLVDRGLPSELRDVGLLDDRLGAGPASPTLRRTSVRMPGQHQYRAYVFCLTPSRRARMRARLPLPTGDTADRFGFAARVMLQATSAEARAAYVSGWDETLADRGRELRSGGGVVLVD